jgi:tRNA nucleotidyltransferase/poly(A) polymerase
VGSAPWPNEYDGFPRFERVMDMFRTLKVVVAHMGSFETRQFMHLMERCPNLYLDTTMAFAPIHHEYRKIETRLNRISVTNDDLVRWQDRIVFGSDFPILPYPVRGGAGGPVAPRPAAPGLRQDLSRQCGAAPGSLVTTRVTLDALGAGARELLQALDEALGPGRPAWLVGGAVRDALSGAIVRDLDLAVPSGAIALARELAGRSTPHSSSWTRSGAPPA